MESSVATISPNEKRGAKKIGSDKKKMEKKSLILGVATIVVVAMLVSFALPVMASEAYDFDCRDVVKSHDCYQQDSSCVRTTSVVLRSDNWVEYRIPAELLNDRRIITDIEVASLGNGGDDGRRIAITAAKRGNMVLTGERYNNFDQYQKPDFRRYFSYDGRTNVFILALPKEIAPESRELISLFIETPEHDGRVWSSIPGLSTVEQLDGISVKHTICGYLP